MPDLTYQTLGLFTAFYPETDAGHVAWLQIFNQTDHTGKVMALHLESTLQQLRAAGYSVAKAARVKMTDDELLSVLTEPVTLEVYP